MSTTGVIYLATGSPKQQQLLSLSRASLAELHPELPLCIISDAAPRTAAERASDSRVRFHIVDSASGTRSRAYKTRLHHISPFTTSLFLDTDVMVRQRIDALWNAVVKNCLAAAPDHHPRVGDALAASLRDGLLSKAEAERTREVCGVDGLYFNSGVLVWRRCPATDHFFDNWYKEWRRFQGRDQFAFARALALTGIAITELPRTYNTSVLPDTTEDRIKEARLLHFWVAPKFSYLEKWGYRIREKNQQTPPATAKDSSFRCISPPEPLRIGVVASPSDQVFSSEIDTDAFGGEAQCFRFSGATCLPHADVSQQLSRFLVESRAQLVYAQSAASGLAAVVAARRTQLPLVVRCPAGDIANAAKDYRFREDFGHLLASAEGVVASDDRLAEQIVELGAKASLVHVAKIGIDGSQFAGADPALAQPRFLWAGPFVDARLPHSMLVAFSAVVHKVPAARLTMLGTGPRLESSRSFSRALGIEASVEFIGSRPDADFPTILRSARASIDLLDSQQPPPADEPIALLQAACAGLPVVAASGASWGEYILDGRTGFVVPVLDVEALSAKLIQLADDPALAGSLGRAGAAHVRQHWPSDAAAQAMLRIVRSVISEGAREV